MPNSMPTAALPIWDIFCQVIDNYGDAGVSWRLARQLAAEHAIAVRLWLDDLSVLARLQPEVDPQRPQQSVAGVQIWAWTTPVANIAPGAVVIEAFGCALPDGWLAAMAACNPAPRWFNLEYLSAEDWVAGVHGLPSPHPRWPLVQQFFCPGFTTATGGLLREADVLTRRAHYSATDRAAAFAAWGVPTIADEAIVVSMFCYPSAPLAALCHVWRHSPRPVICLLADGIGDAAIVSTGALTVVRLPFLPQTDYDTLLWSCDLNFVRGEDSFLRAQWAGRPLVWQIYPQPDQAHHAKLAAFLDAYLAASPTLAAPVRHLHQAWNGVAPDLAAAWATYLPQLPALNRHAQRWCSELAEQPDLASQLVRAAHSI